MPRHSPLPIPLDRQPFAVAEAYEQGVRPGRLRGNDLARPFHGVRLASSAPMVDLARAYSSRMPASRFFSHWTAAQIHGLPLPFTRATAVHVSAIAPARTPRGRGVVGHSSSSSELTEVRGMRVTTAVQTWVDMSAQLGHMDLVVMGDALVRREHPIATTEQLAVAVAKHKGRRGAANLAAAFARVRPRTDSVRETMLRLAIVDFGLPEPQVNFKIVDAHGRFVAWGDLAYPQYRVLAEYDGEQHRTDEKQFFRDVDRLDHLAEERWRTVRFNKSHSRQRLLTLRRALIAAGWRP